SCPVAPIIPCAYGECRSNGQVREHFMDLHLNGHTAVIVGGARGIGLAIAHEFAREGADVALVDRDAETPAAAEMIAKDFRVRTKAWRADVSDFAATEAAAQKIFAHF